MLVARAEFEKEKEDKEISLARLVLFSSIFLVFFISLASAGFDITEAGHITTLNIAQFNISSSWSGYYGDLLTSGSPITGWLMLSDMTLAENVTEKDFTMRCDEISGYLLVSNESTIPDISNLVPGNLSVLDFITGPGTDDGNNTFNQTSNFNIGGNTINNVPTVYPNVNSLSQSSVFREGYLTDGDAIIFVAEINQDTTGFDGDEHDFQFMLPYEVGDEYYIFALFSCKWCGDDICMIGESCSSCPQDCGSCDEEPETQQAFILTPSIQLRLTPIEDIEMEIELDRNIVYIGDVIDGVVIIDYWGSTDFNPTLIISIDGIPFFELPITLKAPMHHLEIPFDFRTLKIGEHEIVAHLKDIERIKGKTEAAAVFVSSGPQIDVCSFDDDRCPKGEPFKCEIFGIDCIIVIIILIIIIGALYLLITKNPKRKGYKGSGKMDWLLAAKYNIQKRS